MSKEKDIENIIRSTLVISNKESIHIAVNKILELFYGYRKCNCPKCLEANNKTKNK